MLENLHVFAAVVEHSSMNKAAAALNLSQPALSRKIAKLEEELGVELFRRIGKRLELTRVGQLTYDYTLELRQAHRRYLQKVEEFRKAGRTPLTIGASLTTLQTTLPDIIQALTASHPEFDIKAITGKTHEIVTLVREHKAEIGIVASAIDDPLLRCVPLFDDHLLLVLPRNQVVTDRGMMTIEDLDGFPMILFSRGTWYRILTDELFDKYHLQPDVKMEIDSFEAILRLLHTCRAGTLLPRSYMRPQLLENNELTVVTIRELEETKRTTSLIYSESFDFAPSIRMWINEVSARYTRGIGR
ncbi:LysR family transcriptional regulator [Paenibacillus cisolokensis]|uniref:Transcriptional regulator n=1 Tax=Paenibacillus cisolokensis TaxID=1658519 RepID=A0ABQ4N9L0_9BACL|nr:MULTISPECIES: LysR family transcriptional regulator [Paenibacillus]ALS26790.1 LysR family transcriptional regulator [Paenibacillus sp. 32O-W]GIQ64857.1 transcriptional regulator [Paenibacillus cisolokensis]